MNFILKPIGPKIQLFSWNTQTFTIVYYFVPGGNMRLGVEDFIFKNNNNLLIIV